MQSFGTRPTLGAMLLQHAIVFLICVVFPGAVTLMAPATWVNFVRSDSGVQCTTRTCMFFVVPFKIQHLAEVKAISSRERAGSTVRQREYGRNTNKTVHVDGEGYLQIRGVDEQLMEVSVSPASLDRVLEKSNAFLNSKESATTLFVIANWKFGGLMGGVLSSFTLLYVVGYTLGFFQRIVSGVQAILSPRRS